LQKIIIKKIIKIRKDKMGFFQERLIDKMDKMDKMEIENFEEMKEQEIRKERNEEFFEDVNEYKVEFISENIEDLKKEFVENNQSEFNEFLKNEIIDDDRDLEYWTEVFCQEIKEDEFDDYCNESYNDYEDIRATERSLINDLCKM